MATLSKVSQETRSVLKWLAISVIAIIFIYILINIATTLKNQYFPTPPPAPTVTFGQLPAITFPKTNQPKNLSYALDTISGIFPDFSNEATVFQFSPTSPNLNNLLQAESFLSQTEFKQTPTPISETLYKWNAATAFNKTLTLNLLTYDFQLSSDYLQNPSMLTPGNLTENNSTDKTQTFLNTLNIPLDNFNQDKTLVTFYTIENGVLSPTDSPANATIARVDLFYKDVDKLPIYFSNPLHSDIYFLIGYTANGTEIIDANFINKKISDTTATYPIKTAQQAFEELKQGQAYIASYDPNFKNIKINNFYLGYYLDNSTKDYLMPIIIMTGDNNFYAYVSAVSYSWIKK